MVKTPTNLDILISALIHDLGKVSYEYFIAKNNSNMPDSHAYILIKRYPFIQNILNIPTIWAPDITYLDIMTKHHETYIDNKHIQIFKKSDRNSRSKNFSIPPIKTRQTSNTYLYTLDYLGNKEVCKTDDIPIYQRKLIRHLPKLIEGTLTDKIEVINKVYQPILTKCPADNRPALAVSIWDHSIDVYMTLKQLYISHPSTLLSHPESMLFHPYGDLKLFCELIELYEKILSASAMYTLRYFNKTLKGINKHISNIPYQSEKHRLFFIRRNIELIKDIAKDIPAEEIQYNFRTIFGIQKPPSISAFALKLISYYLNMRFVHQYTHIGTLFHIFFRRKVAPADVIQLIRHHVKGPWESWVAIPTDVLCSVPRPTSPPKPWVFTNKHHGIKIKMGIYISNKPNNVLMNQSKILFKRIRPERRNFSFDRQ